MQSLFAKQLGSISNSLLNPLAILENLVKEEN
jgi:hypothetical protein